MQKKFFHVYGGNILDKYTVKLYARAYQDLEEIYSYIANSLLEPDTALNMVDASDHDGCYKKMDRKGLGLGLDPGSAMHLL